MLNNHPSFHHTISKFYSRASQYLKMADAFIEAMMNRGEYLRFLKQLELQDEEERKQSEFEYLQEETIKHDNLSVTNIQFVKETVVKRNSNHTFDTFSSSKSSSIDDKVDVLPASKLNVLRYDSYLVHQRYSDDYKHCNCHFVDYPVNDTQRLIVEQQRSLGKGGLIWDAGVILADYLIERGLNGSVVELGSGTGIIGMAIAKAMDVEVNITDLQELLPLMQRNIERNFHSSCVLPIDIKMDEQRGEAAKDIPRCVDKGSTKLSLTDQHALCETNSTAQIQKIKNSQGKIRASTLRWGLPQDYRQTYDTVIGADVVASLYCPKSLAKTIYDLCHEESHVYLALNRRLDDVLVVFQDAMRDLFGVVEEVEVSVRRRNRGVFVLHAFGKR